MYRLIEKAPPLTKALTSVAEERLSACRKAAADQGVALPGAMDEADITRVFAFSEYIARQCSRNPSMLKDLLESGDLERLYEPGEYDRRVAAAASSASDEVSLNARLRRLRHREMVRIAWRDLSSRADLFETLSELSDLADACVAHVLKFLHPILCDQLGTPRGADGTPLNLVVIAMGKLGGRELNFSSDIDLMFAFPEAGKTDGEKPVTNEEFFTRLARRVIDVIGKSTADGFIFRVDARLRPYGESGPLVMSFDAMENYYQMFGREWERYALVKARIIAGDKAGGDALLDRLRPFVYRRYLDYGTFESIREMKRKITREVIRKGITDNIKHGYGGIREIEFFGQVFQLIRGGINPEYQHRGIMKVLRVMTKDRCIPRQVYEELVSAYVFLRNTENRLQMHDDKQTHSLPAEAGARTRLALSMAFDTAEAFDEQLRDHMERVHFHFNELLSPEAADTSAPGKGLEGVWLNPEDAGNNRELLEAAGFSEPGEVIDALTDFRDRAGHGQDGSIAVNRIDRLMPQVLNEAAESDRPDLVFRRIMPLLTSILKRSCYISLLLENPGALQHVMQLARISPWIISFLSTHPLLLDELLDVRSLYAPLDRAALAEELQERISRVDPEDLEYQMDEFRVFKQVNMFRIVAADVTGNLPLMKISDRLTYLAETILDAALRITWRQMVDRYGLPSNLTDADAAETGFAGIAYGKLGGYELGYGSDLDLVFLHTAQPGETAGGSMKPIANSEFYGRLGQRIIHFLSAPTATGKLYETDMRLRPSGNAGVLVSRIGAYEEYQFQSAWIWEHQALIKARAIIGDDDVARQFEEIRRRVIAIERDPERLRREVAEMRQKMLRAHRTAGKDSKSPGKQIRFDLKQDAGGIIDIEFLVQYLILAHSHRHPELMRWTDVVRQLNALALCGIIEDLEAHALKQAYLVYRYFVHRMNLQEKTPVLPDDRLSELRQRVERIWGKYFRVT